MDHKLSLAMTESLGHCTYTRPTANLQTYTIPNHGSLDPGTYALAGGWVPTQWIFDTSACNSW